MELVKARREDYARVEALYYDIIDHTPNMENYAHWKKGLHPSAACLQKYIAESALYLLLDEGTLAGAMAVTMAQDTDYRAVCWGVAARDDEVAVVHILGVSPAYQGHGVGGQMIDAAIRLAGEQHKKALRLDAVVSNAPARQLYTQKGFLYRGQRNLYAENTGWIDFCFYEYACQAR